MSLLSALGAILGQGLSVVQLLLQISVMIIIIVTKIVPIKLSGCGFGRLWCVMSGGADEDQDLG